MTNASRQKTLREKRAKANLIKIQQWIHKDDQARVIEFITKINRERKQND